MQGYQRDDKEIEQMEDCFDMQDYEALTDPSKTIKEFKDVTVNQSVQVNFDEKDLFSQAYEMDYEPSELILLNRFSFCPICLSENQDKHKSTCLVVRDPENANLQPEAREFLTVNVYKHNPPRVDGCPMSDDQCSACQLSLSPSPSYFLISMCEFDLLGNSTSTLDLLDAE